MEGHWDISEDVVPEVAGSGGALGRPFRPLRTEAHCSTALRYYSYTIVIILIIFYHIASLLGCSYNAITIVNYYNTVIIDVNS